VSSTAAEVTIIGAGVVGCAAAAVLAEAGARVQVYERDEVAGAASGRNSGVVQHPFDPVLADLHVETVGLYRELDGLALPVDPAGVLMLARDPAQLAGVAAGIGREAPALRPTLLEPAEVRQLEPALAPGLAGCRLETGFPVRPASATRALARRAHVLGAVFHEHEPAWPWVGSGRARGVIAAGVRRPADAVLVTAGPWTPEVVDTTGAWRPIEHVWGVVAEVELADPPRHVVEEAGVEAVAAGGPSGAHGSVFSAVSADGVTSVGSTFLREQPDPAAWTDSLLSAGAAFLPAIAHAPVRGARACARPQSFDGRPLVGELPGIGDLWVAAGHGPWGISTGPATARIAADAILAGQAVPAELSVSRAA
jgi:glycine/D-amino acid oxidase-like deaminating enzyme